MTKIKESAMDAATRKALEAKGWKFGDAADFLAMTDEERQMLDLRVDADRKSTRLNSSHSRASRMPSSA